MTSEVHPDWKCENCAFYQCSSPEKEWGHCKISAPVVCPYNESKHTFPSVGCHEWCGQFMTREQWLDSMKKWIPIE